MELIMNSFVMVILERLVYLWLVIMVLSSVVQLIRPPKKDDVQSIDELRNAVHLFSIVMFVLAIFVLYNS